MKEQIIKLLKAQSLGKATAVIESLDLGVYIWRKDIFILKDGWDYGFDAEEISEKERESILSEIEKGNFYPSKTFQG